MTPDTPTPSPCYAAPDPRRVSVPLAVILSAMPGLGHIYLGRYPQGFLNVLVTASLVAILDQSTGGAEPLFGMFLSFFWLFNMIDAGRKAHLWNLSLLRADAATEVPARLDRFSLVMTGAGLVVLGVVTLVHRALGFSLEWVGRWWRLALVVVGAALLWKAWRHATPASAEA